MRGQKSYPNLQSVLMSVGEGQYFLTLTRVPWGPAVVVDQQSTTFSQIKR